MGASAKKEYDNNLKEKIISILTRYDK